MKALGFLHVPLFATLHPACASYRFSLPRRLAEGSPPPGLCIAFRQPADGKAARAFLFAVSPALYYLVSERHRVGFPSLSWRPGSLELSAVSPAQWRELSLGSRVSPVLVRRLRVCADCQSLPESVQLPSTRCKERFLRNSSLQCRNHPYQKLFYLAALCQPHLKYTLIFGIDSKKRFVINSKM